MTGKLVDRVSRLPLSTLARIRAVLAGRYDAGKLSPDEAIIFDELIVAILSGTQRAEALALYARLKESDADKESS